ncbi:DNA polymerase Y family protein [Streptomyces sp. NPDC002851]
MILCVRFRPGPAGEALLPALVGLLGELTPVVAALPPDTVLADVRGAVRYFGRDAAELAALVRVRALALHGVDCVIGVGPNPMLARMAAREAGPGLTCVVPESADGVREFLEHKPVAALEGVGRSAARALCAYGLDTVGRVAVAPLGTLQRILGARAGREAHEKARGVDRTAVVRNAATSSIAAERTFPRDELDPTRHRRALLSLTEELGARMRGTGQVCRAVVVTVRYADRSTTVRTRTLREPTAHSADLTAVTYRIYEGLGLQRARVRGIALRAEGLAPVERAARQLTFDPADEKVRRLEGAVDRVRERFGAGAVGPGTLAA